jgi:4-coumarate--CoA ligase (photoactive yellow protein activation family)
LTLASHAADDFCVRNAGVEDYFLARRTLGDWQQLIRETWARSSDPAVVFSTSGSTGTPVRHRHSLALLREEVVAFDAFLPPTKAVRKSVPAHHIYGFLFTVLLPDVRACPTVELEPESPQAEPGDLVVTHPVHLSLWKQRGIAFAAGVNVLSSTSALPEELWDWLEAMGCRVWEIFGSSETAGIGWRTSFRDPFTLLPYWALNTSEGATRLHRAGLAAPLELPDHLESVSETRFWPKGRRDQGIKVAGRLVYPDAVRQVLLAHPAVRDCALRTEVTEGGVRLMAFLVTDGGIALEAELRAWAAQHLETGARPQRYTFGSHLPQKVPGQPTLW